MNAFPQRVLLITRGVVCVWLVLALSGSHWALLQSAAWARMLGDYFTQTGDFKKAVEMTFDGQHPCGMCKSIEQGRENERSPDAPPLHSSAPSLIAVVPLPPFSLPELHATRIEYNTEPNHLHLRDVSPPLLPPPIVA